MFKSENIIKASLILLLIVLGVSLRFSSEIPNFSPMFAIALFSGYVFRNKIVAFANPLLIQLIADYYLGFHPDMFAVYLSFGLITAIGYLNREKYNFMNSILFAVLSSIVFFLITNFSVWLTADFYTKDLNGLFNSFTLAVPFYRNTLLSSVIFSVVIFGSYSFILRTDTLGMLKSK